MPKKKKNNKKGKKSFHILLILLLVAAGAFLFYKELGKEKIREKTTPAVRPEKKKVPAKKISGKKVAIVIDDLGENRRAARELLNINAGFTCAMLPHQTHTEWIAGECSRLGHEVIVHVPMEAKSPQRLGKGGLYTWMTDREIIDNVKDDISSVPHAIGISNHMGSALTEDPRAMRAVISVIKERKLFFLDSLTTPGSVGYSLAKGAGVRSLRRDVFLDDEDSPAHIRKQWANLLKTADRNGSAIALGHPKENTIKFLKEVLQKKEIKVVPLSDLLK